MLRNLEVDHKGHSESSMLIWRENQSWRLCRVRLQHVLMLRSQSLPRFQGIGMQHWGAIFWQSCYRRTQWALRYVNFVPQIVLACSSCHDYCCPVRARVLLVSPPFDISHKYTDTPYVEVYIWGTCTRSLVYTYPELMVTRQCKVGIGSWEKQFSSWRSKDIYPLNRIW